MKLRHAAGTLALAALIMARDLGLFWCPNRRW